MDDRLQNRRTRRGSVSPVKRQRTAKSLREQEEKAAVVAWLGADVFRHVVQQRLARRIAEETELVLKDREMSSGELHVAQERIALLQRLLDDPVDFLLGK